MKWDLSDLLAYFVGNICKCHFVFCVLYLIPIWWNIGSDAVKMSEGGDVSFWQFVFFSKLTLSSDGLQGSSSQILNIWFWVAVLQRIILSKYVTMNNDRPACEYQKLSEASRKYWDLEGKNFKLAGPWPCSSREKQLGERLDGGKNRHESILYAPKSLCKTSSISQYQKNTH